MRFLAPPRPQTRNLERQRFSARREARREGIRYSDRATLTNPPTSHNCCTLSTGVLADEMQPGIASIPLEDAPVMRVGYLMHAERKVPELVGRYIDELGRVKTILAMRRRQAISLVERRVDADHDVAGGQVRLACGQGVRETAAVQLVLDGLVDRALAEVARDVEARDHGRRLLGHGTPLSVAKTRR